MSAAGLPSSVPFDVDSGAPAPNRLAERLAHAVQELSLARTLTDVQRIVRTSARDLTRCDGATFVLRDDRMCHFADEDAIEPLWKGMRFPLETCISGWTMLNRRPAVIGDIYSDARTPHPKYRPTFVKSLVVVPIRRLDPVGAIGAYWATSRQASNHEIAVLQALADSTSIALEHVRVYSELEQRARQRTSELEKANDEIRRLSLTDDLTGVFNRRGFYVLAEAALVAARNRGHDGLLAYLDVDGLKHVNDEAGHDVGDELIADVATVLRSTFDPSDIVARIGGDEFCVLVAEYDGHPNILRAKLSDAFEAFNHTGGRRYRLSASLGLVRVAATGTKTLEQLLAEADAQMYAHKKAKLGA